MCGPVLGRYRIHTYKGQVNVLMGDEWIGMTDEAIEWAMG